MNEYEATRAQFKPLAVKWLLVAESPPPEASRGGSRHFYRTNQIRPEDRLFLGAIKALYPDSKDLTDKQIEEHKFEWLKRLQADGIYMIEALEVSQEHAVKKPERQEKIRLALPRLIERVGELANSDTKLILIKSNVFEVAAEPLRVAGFTVLNQALVDYPGVWNKAAYQEKLTKLMVASGWCK